MCIMCILRRRDLLHIRCILRIHLILPPIHILVLRIIIIIIIVFPFLRIIIRSILPRLRCIHRLLLCRIIRRLLVRSIMSIILRICFFSSYY